MGVFFCFLFFFSLGNELNPLIRQQEEARRLQKGWCRLQAWTRKETHLFRSYEPLTQLSHVKKISFLNWSLHSCRTTFTSARKIVETRETRHNHSSPYLNQLKLQYKCIPVSSHLQYILICMLYRLSKKFQIIATNFKISIHHWFCNNWDSLLSLPVISYDNIN